MSEGNSMADTRTVEGKFIHFLAGEHIANSVDRLVAAAREYGSASGFFNDIELKATATTTPEEVVSFYNSEIDRRVAAFINSPEGKEAERITHIDGPQNERQTANAAFIAAANPSTVLSLLKENEELRKALEGMLDMFIGYSCPQLDAAITAMQRIGRDRWSMVYQMKASVFEFDDGETDMKSDETLSKIENTTDGFIVSYWSGRFSKIFPTLEEAVEAHKDNFCRN